MNLRAKKSFGQNFLNSPSVVAKMVQTSGISDGDLVVEVGPGKGVLTKALLAQGAYVVAFEIDPRMVEYLRETFAIEVSHGKLEIIEGDILEQDLSLVLGNKPYKLVANIPYYITNGILRYFLETSYQPTSICILVQHEVAERIARDQKESILSLSVKVYGNPRYLMKVSRRYFSPAPKVDSAVLFIDMISKQKFSNETHEKNFFRLVKQGFAHRRKQLMSNIVDDIHGRDYWSEQLIARAYDLQVRAEDVRLEDWLYFSGLL